MHDTDTHAMVAWPLALAAAAVAGTLATACMMPFVAVATLAAATMDRRRALVAVLGAWGANQLLGFGLLGYPWDASAAAWGLALGVASVAAMLVASRVLGGSRPPVLRLVAAFVAAFVAFEALLFAFALVAGGTGTFTPAIVATLLANDAAWLVALAAFHFVLTRLAPGAFGRAPAVRLA